MIILARHGETPANSAHTAESPESRVQGFSKDMPLSPRGEAQTRVFGCALGLYAAERCVTIGTTYTSDALRATASLDNALERAELEPEPTIRLTDARLRELNKGSLEGVLRSEAYPTDAICTQQATDWHFRHGTLESGGETAYEAGQRWLEWFNETVPAAEGFNGSNRDSAMLVVGHNLVTSYGLWMLTHPDETAAGNLPSLKASRAFRIENATAQVVDVVEGQWAVVGSIVP